MSVLSAEMAFEIGDLVYSKTAFNTLDQRPVAFVVTERLVQQCHGGVQRMYRLNADGLLYPEIMLTRDCPAIDESAEIARAQAARRIKDALWFNDKPVEPT